MAEFLNNPRKARAKEITDDGFGAFGKPVPTSRRSAALNHIRDMGVQSAEDAWECIGNMSRYIQGHAFVYVSGWKSICNTWRKQ